MGVPLDILCELENINRSEVTKIINSINNRKSYDDRQLFCKIINYIQS